MEACEDVKSSAFVQIKRYSFCAAPLSHFGFGCTRSGNSQPHSASAPSTDDLCDNSFSRIVMSCLEVCSPSLSYGRFLDLVASSMVAFEDDIGHVTDEG